MIRLGQKGTWFCVSATLLLAGVLEALHESSSADDRSPGKVNGSARVCVATRSHDDPIASVRAYALSRPRLDVLAATEGTYRFTGEILSEVPLVGDRSGCVVLTGGEQVAGWAIIAERCGWCIVDRRRPVAESLMLPPGAEVVVTVREGYAGRLWVRGSAPDAAATDLGYVDSSQPMRLIGILPGVLRFGLGPSAEAVTAWVTPHLSTVVSAGVVLPPVTRVPMRVDGTISWPMTDFTEARVRFRGEDQSGRGVFVDAQVGDSDGALLRFHATVPAAGPYVLSVTANSSVDGSLAEWRKVVQVDEGARVLDVKVPRNGRVAVVVSSADEDDLGSVATVTWQHAPILESAGGIDIGGPVHKGHQLGEGGWEVVCPAGRIAITGSASGYVASTRTVVVGEGGEVTLAVQLKPTK